MDNVDNVENTEQEERLDDPNHIQDLIKASLDKDYNHANKIFGEVMTIKMSDLLDQEKVRLADQIYNGVPEEEEEEVEVDNEDNMEDPEDEVEEEEEEVEIDDEDNMEDPEDEVKEEEDETEEEEEDEEEEIEGAAV